jgi:hypothetical protein
MSVRRATLALATAVCVIGLAGCGGGSSSATVAQSTPAASESATPSETSSVTPSDSPTPTSSDATAVTGTASDFCGAFAELDNLPDNADAATGGAAMQAAAADMKKYAPAEIKDSVETYANVVAAAGQAIASGGGEGNLQAALATAIAGNAADVAKVAVYVAKNCK